MKKNGYVKRNPRLIARLIEGTFAVLDPEAGRLYELNGTASEIWRILARKNNIDSLAEKIAAKYDAPVATVRKDVDSFVKTSLKNKLLVSA